MTNQEFSDEFDLLYNNISSNQAPGLDEYEKSVFLTTALDEIIKSYFNPKLNKLQEGFDGSEKRLYDFSNLIRVASLFDINSIKERVSDIEKIDRRSQVFIFPENYFLSINEVIIDSYNNAYSVVPLLYTEYQRLMMKPYAYPTKRSAWRLFTDKKNCNYILEYIKVDNEDTSCDYTILSTWADLKRILKVLITAKSTDEDISGTGVSINNTEGSIIFEYDPGVKDDSYRVKVVLDKEWSSDKLTYKIYADVFISSTKNILKVDDAEIIDILKLAYKAYISMEKSNVDSTIYKVFSHIDGFMQCEAPSEFRNFFTINNNIVVGKTLNTKIISLPIAEIIGKFLGNIRYLLRYIRRPQPIILRDLTDSGVSIRGKESFSECELSSELHPEILQRAVELAKAAYTGDLNSQVALGTNSQTNMGMLTSGANKQ